MRTNYVLLSHSSKRDFLCDRIVVLEKVSEIALDCYVSNQTVSTRSVTSVFGSEVERSFQQHA